MEERRPWDAKLAGATPGHRRSCTRGSLNGRPCITRNTVTSYFLPSLVISYLQGARRLYLHSSELVFFFFFKGPNRCICTKGHNSCVRTKNNPRGLKQPERTYVPPSVSTLSLHQFYPNSVISTLYRRYTIGNTNVIPTLCYVIPTLCYRKNIYPSNESGTVPARQASAAGNNSIGCVSA